LNALSPARQQSILDRIASLRRERKLALVESQESFDLIKEGENWRLFFDWASGARVRFDFRAPPGSGIEMDFVEKEIVARPQEPFLVHFKIKNHGRREVTATIAHRIEPAAARDNLQMIQCGLLSPLDLAPGSEREMAGVYLLDGPPDIKHLSIAYEFQLAPAASASPSRAASPVKGN
jgi:cytochrome c oxidase assembly protein Cox11